MFLQVLDEEAAELRCNEDSEVRVAMSLVSPSSSAALGEVPVWDHQLILFPSTLPVMDLLRVESGKGGSGTCSWQWQSQLSAPGSESGVGDSGDSSSDSDSAVLALEADELEEM